jgi:hypothetical protein
VTSNRRRKQKAQALGLNAAELQLCELLAQVIELLRWNQVLGYSNQYLLHEKLGVPAAERHRVMKAAAQAVEQDGRLQDWGRRLIEIQESLQQIERSLRGEPGEAAAGPDADQQGAAEAAGGQS